jgi:hypothetical protein
LDELIKDYKQPEDLIGETGLLKQPALISEVTDAVMEEAKAWRNRPLEPLYTIVYVDALAHQAQAFDAPIRWVFSLISRTDALRDCDQEAGGYPYRTLVTGGEGVVVGGFDVVAEMVLGGGPEHEIQC